MDKGISVLLPFHKETDYLEISINSIISSNFPCNWELILIPNNATSESLSVAQNFASNQVRILNNVRFMNLGSALNLGISEAKYSYVARMDADDVSLPSRMERQFVFLELNPDYFLVGGQFWIIDEINEITGLSQLPESNGEIRAKLHHENVIAHPTTMFRRDEAVKLGGYSEILQYAEDYEFWLRAISVHKFCNLSEPLLKYRRHKNAVGELRFKQQGKESVKVKIALSNEYRYLRTLPLIFILVKKLAPIIDIPYGSLIRNLKRKLKQ